MWSVHHNWWREVSKICGERHAGSSTSAVVTTTRFDTLSDKRIVPFSKTYVTLSASEESVA